MNGYKCFIPTCRNNVFTNRDLMYFKLRDGLKEKWCKIVGSSCPTGPLFTCEIHIDLKEDIENYEQWKSLSSQPRLKLTATLKNYPSVAETSNAPVRTSMTGNEKHTDERRAMTRDVKSFKINSVEYFFPIMETPPWKEKEDLFRRLVAPTVENTEEEESRREKLVGKQKSLDTNAFYSKVTKKKLSKKAKMRTDLWTEAVAAKTHEKVPSEDEIISTPVPWHTQIKILNANSMCTETGSLKAWLEEGTSNSIVAFSHEEEESSKEVVVRVEMESRLQAAQICFIKDPLRTENVTTHSSGPQECTVRVKIEPPLEDSISTNVDENTSSVENVTEARYLMQEMCSRESVNNKLRENHSMTDTQKGENLENSNVRVKQEPLWEDTMSYPMTANTHTQKSTREGQTIPVTEYTQESSKEAILVKVETVSNRMADPQGELVGIMRNSSIDGVIGVSAAAARAGLYAGHEVTGDLVVGPECLHRPSVVFTRETLMHYLSGVEHDHTYASLKLPPDTGELNLLRQMKDCYVRLQRCDKHFKHNLKTETFRRKSNIYMCDICGKTYEHRRSIVRHIQTHIKSKFPTDNSSIQRIIYECDTCGKIYKYMTTFIRHIHTHNRQEKVMRYEKNTYSCQICKKGFKQLRDLQRHEQTHTGEKPAMFVKEDSQMSDI